MGLCLQELAFSDSDSDLEDVGSSSEEGEEEGTDEADPAALTAAEAAAAARAPVPLVLELWAKNEARLEAEQWLPQRSPDPGMCLSPCQLFVIGACFLIDPTLCWGIAASAAC